MFGLRLILILAVVGGLIAFIGDKLGSKIGKKKLSVFGLRPYHTSVLMTVITGILIASITLVTMAVASDSARTAMFGMEKLQNELAALNREKDQASVALAKAQADVAEKNKAILALDEQIKASAAEKAAIENQLVAARQNYEEAKGQLQQAQSAVGELSQAKQSLEGEVTNLEQMTERLRRGILAIREGQVVFRSGEVVYAGVLKGSLNDEENSRQMQLFLATANEVTLHRMGIEAEEPVQAIWMPNEVIEEALTRIKAAQGNIFVRVRTVANIIAGEPAVCTLELAADNRIYKNNELIFSKEIDLEQSESSMNGEILEFLSDINRVAVAAGVIPDPLTGKVGNMDAGTMVETGEKMAKYGGLAEDQISVHPAALDFRQGVKGVPQQIEHLLAIQELLGAGLVNTGGVFDPVITVQGIISPVVAHPLRMGGLGPLAGHERLGHFIGDFDILIG